MHLHCTSVILTIRNSEGCPMELYQEILANAIAQYLTQEHFPSLQQLLEAIGSSGGTRHDFG